MTRRYGSGPTQRSAGGVVVRRRAEGLVVALAEERDRNLGARRVRLPKGRIDPGESAEQAALREVAEETGIEARILEPLGEVAYAWFEASEARRVAKRVRFFLMAWRQGHGHPADGEMERVFWAPIESAATLLDFDSERDMVLRARALLESREPPLL